MCKHSHNQKFLGFAPSRCIHFYNKAEKSWNIGTICTINRLKVRNLQQFFWHLFICISDLIKKTFSLSVIILSTFFCRYDETVHSAAQARNWCENLWQSFWPYHRQTKQGEISTPLKMFCNFASLLYFKNSFWKYTSTTRTCRVKTIKNQVQTVSW